MSVPTRRWGVGSFENDEAEGFLDDLIVSDGTIALDFALSIDPARARLDAELAGMVVAAAEVVATLGGRPPMEVPDELSAWLLEHVETDPGRYSGRCTQLLDAVLEEGSALRALWDKEQRSREWAVAVEELRTRVGG